MIRLTIRFGKSRSKRKTKKRARSGRRGLVRLALVALVLLLVAASLVVVQVRVSVSNRFEGRLWKLPSRIYSDVLFLTPGAGVTAEQLAERLERCGYAQTGGRPARPGQYALDDSTVEIYLRSFASPVVQGLQRRAVLAFEAGRLRSIRDDEGRPLPNLVLEPELLATLYGPRQEERQLITLDEVPQRFVDAVLAAEDSRFFSHHGLDLRGILRAGAVNLRRGRIVQGGSTISQQTVKNLYLGQERTWWRKFREALMALVLDGRYPKERILEVYLNEVYLGQRGPVAICGVQAASRFYFGRDLRDLSLGEWALLAGLIRSPGRYNPHLHPQRALERRGQVLEGMLRLGLAGEREVAEARQEVLNLGSGAGGFAQAPYAVDFVRARLAERFSRSVLLEEGLSVYTTLDTRLQQRAETVLREGLSRLERTAPAIREQAGQRSLQGALVATKPSNGAILALVGGRDHERTQFNRAVQAWRQPGSCFKPFVYAAGFERSVEGGEGGLTPETLLEDAPLELRAGGRSWSPQNYDGNYRGPVTARQALEESLNVPTVRAAQRVGVDAVIRTARRCGIESPLSEVPSLALGTAEVTPLELAAAFGVFAREGTRIPPWVIRAVADADGEWLEGRYVERSAALSPGAAYQVNDVLEGVFRRGTARSAALLGFRGRAAGKTGTTDGTRDAWFVGYSGDLLALVWVGYDDNARTGLSGATGALPIWVEFMKPDAAPVATTRPAGLIRVRICSASGLRATKRCPEPLEEWFEAGSEPTGKCTEHAGRFRRWLRKTLKNEQ